MMVWFCRLVGDDGDDGDDDGDDDDDGDGDGDDYAQPSPRLLGPHCIVP